MAEITLARAGALDGTIPSRSPETGLVIEEIAPLARFILRGRGAIEPACAALDPAAFPVGKVCRTLFAKAEIVLWRRGDETFHLEVWRSFAPYVASLLTEIRAELAAEGRGRDA